MSRVGPFAVGIVVAGIGYGALSQQLVYSRNRLMAKHFEADSAELYYPRRVSARSSLDACGSRLP